MCVFRSVAFLRRLSVLASFCAGLVFSLTAGSALAKPVVGPAEQALNAYLAEVDSLSAEFEQELLDVDQLVVQRSKGLVLVQRPDRFRWDYTLPYEQLIVSDGQRLWIYDKDLEQATVKAQDEGVERSPAMILSSKKPVRDEYFVEELGENDGTQWLRLTPRQNDSEYREIRLGFIGADLRVMELHDNFSQVTRLRFFAVHRNPRIEEALFHFSPPKGVDVVGDLEAR